MIFAALPPKLKIYQTQCLCDEDYDVDHDNNYDDDNDKEYNDDDDKMFTSQAETGNSALFLSPVQGWPLPGP